MRAAAQFVDPLGVALAVGTGLVIVLLQEGPVVAAACALSVIAVRVVAGILAVRRLRPSAFATKALPGDWYTPLTPKEAAVALLVAEGLKDKEIAARLDRSDRTVETHVLNINTKLTKFTKMPFHNRSQIAVWMTEQRARAAAASAPDATARKPVPK